MQRATGRQSGRRHFIRSAWVAALAGVALVAGPPSAARAQPVCPAAGTLRSLIDFGATGCVIGDKVFHFFGSTITATGFTTTLTESDITYTVINPAPGALIHGFELSGAWFAPAGGTLDHNLRSRVSTLAGARFISDIHLLQTGEDVLGNPPVTGFVDIDEDVCVGALFLGGCAANGGFIASISTFYSENPALYGPSNHEASAAWGPPYVSVLDIDKDIVVFGGNGGALFSNFHQTVSQVPEPATVALMGGGLALFGIAARCRRRVT